MALPARWPSVQSPARGRPLASRDQRRGWRVAKTGNIDGPSTQTQALSAILFLYREVLARPVGEIPGLIRARRTQRLPVVLTRDEVRAVLGQLAGESRLKGSILYGTGLRPIECLRLRVHDLDLKRVSESKSDSGTTPFRDLTPETLQQSLDSGGSNRTR